MPKILAIEDDKYLSEAYKMKLSEEGFEVEVAYNVADAKDIIETFNPDLILLDILMPEANGKDYLKELKSGPHKDIPVIVASNLDDHNFVKMIKKEGAFDYIVKSGIAIDDLIYKLKNHFNMN